MLRARLAPLALIALLLAACGTTSPTPPGGPGDPDPTPDPNPDPPQARCTHTLADDVNMPTRLAPTGAEVDCDYLLSGSVGVYSALTIDPGTRILAAPESMLTIEDGGRITAHGTEAAPITFQGSVAVQGSWYGICFSGQHLESSFDFVNIYWAGGVRAAGSTVCRAALGSVTDGGEPVHMTNSLVVGSYTSGIDATRFSLGEFSHNVLAGHREYGMRVSPDNMGRLNDTTNFGGTGIEYEDGSSAANRRPYVFLDGGVLEVVGETQYWVPVDVPYYVSRDEFPYSRAVVMLDEHTTTIIEPGTRFVMSEGTEIYVEANAALGLNGTPERPVRFIGERPGSGSWGGLNIAGGGLLADHVVISGAGTEEWPFSPAAISFWTVDWPSHCSHVRNTTIIGSAANGVLIDSDYYGLVRLDAMTYEDIALDEVVGENTGPAILDREPCSPP